jgi:hypothetical protein
VLVPTLTLSGHPGAAFPVDPAVKSSLLVILDFPVKSTDEPGPPAAPPPSQGPTSALVIPPASSDPAEVPRHRSSASIPSPLAQTVIVGLTDTILSQIRAGGGLPLGSAATAIGDSAVISRVVVSLVPLRFIPSNPLSPGGQDTGAGSRGEPSPGAETSRGSEPSTLLQALRSISGPLSRVLSGAWERLQGALSALGARGKWPMPLAAWIEVIENALGRPDPLWDRVGQLLAGLWGGPEIEGDPTSERPRERVGAAQIGPEGPDSAGVMVLPGAGIVAPAADRVSAEEPAGAEGDGLPISGEEAVAESEVDSGGDSRAPIAALVIASALGIIRVHRPGRSAEKRKTATPATIPENTHVPPSGKA